MITLTIKDQCCLCGVTNPKTVTAILNALRVKNPDFVSAQHAGRSTWYIKEYLCLATQAEDGKMTFPREARQEVLKLMESEQVEIHDERLKLPPIVFDAPAVPMRDYQQASINVAARIGSGVVEAPCGAGKTNIAQGIIQRIGQPTLWLTHKIDLLGQSMDRCKMLLNVQDKDIGLISRGRVKVGKKITFATVQTMAKLSDEELQRIGQSFGLILVDECHHVFSTPHQVTQFARCISFMPAYYRFGITATATRTDGLHQTMNWLLGKVIYSVPRDKLEEQGFIIKPLVKKLYTAFEYVQPDAKLDFNDLLSCMTGDDRRNRLLLDVIEGVAPFSCILVLTARVEHAEYLYARLVAEAPEFGPELVHGEVKDRDRIYDAVKAGECRILIATNELAKEGLDLPRLDTLLYATPQKNATAVRQSIGRVVRPAEGKTGATVLDIVDRRVTVLRRQFTARKKIYDEYKLTIQEVVAK